MKVKAPRWTVRLATAAEADFQDILEWTVDWFGAKQARVYALTLSSAIQALADGPTIAGVKAREDIGPDVSTLHVARGRRKGRHFIVFRARQARGNNVIEILRILHDAMDLQRHIDDQEDEG